MLTAAEDILGSFFCIIRRNRIDVFTHLPEPCKLALCVVARTELDLICGFGKFLFTREIFLKFLVSDSTLAPDFTTTVSQKKVGVEAGETYSVSYSGAVTSTDSNTDAGNQNDSKLVISAIVYDENGTILYYGNLIKKLRKISKH